MRVLARISAGLIVWAFGFSLLYALHGWGCAYGLDSRPLAGASVFVWVLAAVWIALLAGGATIVWWANQLPVQMERRLALSSAVVGLACTAVTGSPIVLTSACL